MHPSIACKSPMTSGNGMICFVLQNLTFSILSFAEFIETDNSRLSPNPAGCFSISFGYLEHLWLLLLTCERDCVVLAPVCICITPAKRKVLPFYPTGKGVVSVDQQHVPHQLLRRHALRLPGSGFGALRANIFW